MTGIKPTINIKYYNIITTLYQNFLAIMMNATSIGNANRMMLTNIMSRKGKKVYLAFIPYLAWLPILHDTVDDGIVDLYRKRRKGENSRLF